MNGFQWSDVLRWGYGDWVAVAVLAGCVAVPTVAIVRWAIHRQRCRDSQQMTPWQRRVDMEGQGMGFDVLPPNGKTGVGFDPVTGKNAGKNP